MYICICIYIYMYIYMYIYIYIRFLVTGDTKYDVLFLVNFWEKYNYNLIDIQSWTYTIMNIYICVYIYVYIYMYVYIYKSSHFSSIRQAGRRQLARASFEAAQRRFLGAQRIQEPGWCGNLQISRYLKCFLKPLKLFSWKIEKMLVNGSFFMGPHEFQAFFLVIFRSRWVIQNDGPTWPGPCTRNPGA